MRLKQLLSFIMVRLICGSVLLLTVTAAADELTDQLKSVPHRIVYETWKDGNWELCSSRADGSGVVNLTNTPDAHELYPHASPDGTKICFVCDEGAGPDKVRNVYIMSVDGTHRMLVARNARQPCWGPDSIKVAYLKGEVEQFTYTDYATKEVWIYDRFTDEHKQHPNKELFHLYNLCWSPDGKWFVATVHAGMGFRHAIVAFEVDGTDVYNLRIPGCRPDISPDGKRIAWGPSDWDLRVGDLDFSGDVPRVVNARDVVTSVKPMKIYHIDWSPDGTHVAFSRGPATKILGTIPEVVGARARNWDIWVADASATNRIVQITSNGACNKEPDWISAQKETP